MGGHYERDIFRQLEEVYKTLETFRKEAHENELRLKLEHAQREQESKALIQQQNETIKQLTKTIEDNNTLIQKLLEEIERLKSQKNKDSHNSSKPPSSDTKPKKLNTYNGRSKSTKAKGGQNGHEGNTMTKADVGKLLQTKGCKHIVVEHGDKTKDKGYVVKYEVDLSIEILVIEHRIYKDAKGNATIPEGYRSDVTYGNTLRGIAVYLYSEGVVAFDRIRSFVSGLSGNRLNVSIGWVYNSIRKFSEKAKLVLGRIINRLMNKRVLMTDATIVTQNGKQHYIRNISSEDAVLYCAMPRKTLEEMRKLPILTKFTGTLEHDHETTLYHFGTGHGECNVHVLRYLTKNTEDTGHSWSKRMKAFLSKANEQRKKHIAEETPFSEAELKAYEEEFRTILAEGRKENETCKPKWAKEDENTLLNRLEKYRENHLLFLYDFDVPFDNNLSERDLRKCKNRQKMSGGFRTEEGVDMFSAILSVVETCKRHASPILDSIIRLFQNSLVLFEGE